MSLSFTAAIEILDQAMEKIREAQNIQESVKEKIEEAKNIQRQAADKLDEARNELKTVYALGPIGDMAPILERMDTLESDAHHKMITMMSSVEIESNEMVEEGMGGVLQAIEDLKGN